MSAAAAALAAKLFSPDAHQFNRIKTVRQIVCDTHGNAGFAVRHTDKGDDAAAELLLALIDQTPQIPRATPSRCRPMN